MACIFVVFKPAKISGVKPQADFGVASQPSACPGAAVMWPAASDKYRRAVVGNPSPSVARAPSRGRAVGWPDDEMLSFAGGARHRRFDERCYIRGAWRVVRSCISCAHY